MLSDTPRQKLAAMIALDGIKVASDAKLCEALLKDYCGEYRLEIAALSAAVKWGIPKSLKEPGLVPPATLRANLARRLQENHGLAEEPAFWAVDAWASVLTQVSSGALTPGAEGYEPTALMDNAWSSPPAPASPAQPQPQPQVQSPYQPPTPRQPANPAYQAPSPTLPPLPKPPSEPQAAPPPKPAGPVQSPPMPSLPQQPSLVAPPPKPTYQPPSPPLPPLPKSPSIQPAAPPPRPAWQAQSPPVPTPPIQTSQAPPPRQISPAYQPAPQSSYVPAASIPQIPVSAPPAPVFLLAAQTFESSQMSPQLVHVQTYLKQEVKIRPAAGLMGELQNAGVQPLTAKRMVKQAMRTEAVRHIGIAVGVLIGTLLLMSISASMRLGFETISYILVGFAFVYLVYRGIRLVETL